VVVVGVCVVGRKSPMPMCSRTPRIIIASATDINFVLLLYTIQPIRIK
jgi:hypothetical protein